MGLEIALVNAMELCFGIVASKILPFPLSIERGEAPYLFKVFLGEEDSKSPLPWLNCELSGCDPSFKQSFVELGSTTLSC